MPLPAFPFTPIGLDLLMIVYTTWILSTSRPLGKSGWSLAGAMLAWLALLHAGLSSRALFPESIGGPAFLAIIFGAVGLVGALLLFVPAARDRLAGLDASRLLLLQGVRVLFGAAFLVQASTGELPAAFGILDGITHAGAGFFGLVAAWALAAGESGRRRAWFANVFGLADILVVATTLALVLLPEIGPHHGMMYAVFLPAPLWFWFHVLSMRQLLAREEHLAAAALAGRVA